jgi:hypothetical protein
VASWNTRHLTGHSQNCDGKAFGSIELTFAPCRPPAYTPKKMVSASPRLGHWTGIKTNRETGTDKARALLRPILPGAADGW